MHPAVISLMQWSNVENKSDPDNESYDEISCKINKVIKVVIEF